MAYNPKVNGRAFAGASSPWAKNLAAIVACEWVHTGARTVFAAQLALTGRQLIVVPKVGRCQIEAVVFYCPKLAGDNLGKLLHAEAWGTFEELVRDWRRLGRAFVHFSIDPSKPDPLEIIDHNGSVRIVNELIALDRPHLPTLREFDSALGCSLEEARVECDHVFRLHGGPRLPLLSDTFDSLPKIPLSVAR